jgi:hypothetical protein
MKRLFFLLLLTVFAVNVSVADSNAFSGLNGASDDFGIEIRAASVFPLGNLREIFKFAPGVDLSFCLPVQKNTTLDFGILAVFPVQSASFVYYSGNEAYDARPEYLTSLHLRYAYRHQLLANLSCKSYFGLGFSFIQTDLLKEENEYGDEAYYDIKAIDFHGGISLRYKHIGCFIEYHHVPYANFNAKRIAYNFGGNFLNTGLSYYF